MLAAVSYLHRHGIIHRDLKLENFLFTSPHRDAELVMIDFGLSKHFETGQHHHEPCGTPYTVAPEVIHGDYDEKVDVWALGVITYLILSGETPFGGLDEEDDMEVKDRILRAHPDFEPRALWAGLSDSAKCFVERLLNPDPTQRPTAKQAQQDPWVRICTHTEKCRLRPATVEALLAFQRLSELEKLQSELLSFTLFPKQIADLRKEFNKLDTEGDGEVSLVTLKNAVAGSIDSAELEAAFDSIKLRRSALTLRWHEFLAAMISLARVDERNMRLAFDRLDRQAKGSLSLDELTCVLGSSIDSWDLQRALSPSLGAQTGHITYSEFKRIPSFITLAI
jgi:calcium-dependent protein kinase